MKKQPPETSHDKTSDMHTSIHIDSLESSDFQPNSKLQFTKEEKEIEFLEQKAEKYAKAMEQVCEKLPAKIVKKKQRTFDEEKGKATSKLTFEKEIVPIDEAKWNLPKKKSILKKITSKTTSITTSKIHSKIHQVEHENIAVEATHKAELMGESTYRGAKGVARSAYRFHKNRPYRQLANLKQKSIKNQMKLDYQKALRDNPKLKTNLLSRFFQKRAIKRQYAQELKLAKTSARATRTGIGIASRAFNMTTSIVRRNPIFLVKAGLLVLVVLVVISLFSMCASMFSGTTAFIGIASYTADYEDINAASILYTRLEAELRMYLNDIRINHPNFDEFRFSIAHMGHDPLMLMAFLTTKLHDFTFTEAESLILQIFAAQYSLELVGNMEIRTRTETWTDSMGNTFTIIVEYEWHILTTTLTARPFEEVLFEFMSNDQTQHYTILMYSLGARQFVGNPFDFNWLPFVTSHYGYRIHPIHRDKRFHHGIDIALPTGTPIRAGFDGTVITASYNNIDGYFVIIESSDGIRAKYAHCHNVFVSVGQTIVQGEVIATVGNTGASTGSHLHMEVFKNGRRLNPIFFVETRT